MNRTLAEFLVADNRPKGTKNYPEVNGFLYAVACSPEVLTEAQWKPVIFDDQDPVFESQEERDLIEQGLRDELAQIEKSISEQKPVMAEYFRPDEEMMENFEEDSPIAHWGIGFLSGHQWLEELWAAYLPPDKVEELQHFIDTLSFFADKNKAVKLCQYQKIVDLSLDVYAETVIENFDAAGQAYAYYGLSIRQALQAHQMTNG